MASNIHLNRYRNFYRLKAGGMLSIASYNFPVKPVNGPDNSVYHLFQ